MDRHAEPSSDSEKPRRHHHGGRLRTPARLTTTAGHGSSHLFVSEASPCCSLPCRQRSAPSCRPILRRGRERDSAGRRSDREGADPLGGRRTYARRKGNSGAQPTWGFQSFGGTPRGGRPAGKPRPNLNGGTSWGQRLSRAWPVEEKPARWGDVRAAVRLGTADSTRARNNKNAMAQAKVFRARGDRHHWASFTHEARTVRRKGGICHLGAEGSSACRVKARRRWARGPDRSGALRPGVVFRGDGPFWASDPEVSRAPFRSNRRWQFWPMPAGRFLPFICNANHKNAEMGPFILVFTTLVNRVRNVSLKNSGGGFP